MKGQKGRPEGRPVGRREGMTAWLRVAAALLLSALAACSPSKGKAPESPVLAVVNGVPITVRQFKDKAELSSHGFSNLSGGEAQAGDAKMDLLGQMIEEAMYLQEAKRLDISVSDAEVEERLGKVMADYPGGSFVDALKRDGIDLARYKDDLKNRLTVEKLIRSQVYSKTGVDEKRVKEYYEGHKDEFRKSLRVRARQIVLDNKADAEAVLKELKKGADFAKLAEKRSLSPDSNMGGDLGYFSKGDMPPEFEAVVFKMKPGETSQVVRSPYGYHIFRLEGVQKAKSPSFEEVEPEVRRKLLMQVGEDAFNSWREELKGKTSIKVNFDVLGGI